MGERSSAESDVYMKIVDDNAILTIGDYVFIGKGTEFDVMEKLTIGDHTVIAPNCFMTDHTHGTSPELRIDQQPCVAGPVTIGKDVWIGVGVTVLPGITIGDGAIIGAQTVVTKNIPPMAVAAGVPAKILRYRHAEQKGKHHNGCLS
jgi:acetyltransferase-like isoleucine patch superfamily enzyme